MRIRIILSLALLLILSTSAFAEKTIIYQTTYGVKNILEPATVIEKTSAGETHVYQTHTGFATTRDYSKPMTVIKEDVFGNTEAYKTLPGTTFRDWSEPAYKIEKSNW